MIEIDNLAEIKEKYQVPQEFNSCHTAIVDGYVVEGHVPVSEVNRMLDGCGVTVTPGCPAELAQAISSLLDDPGRRAELGRRARQHAEGVYNWRHTTQNLVLAYERAMTLGGKQSTAS